MQARIVQAVGLIGIVIIMASCSAGKEYSSKLFAPRNPSKQVDSQAVAAAPLRFLNIDSSETTQEGWVTTDIIMGRDSSGSTTALDRLANNLPLKNSKTDTTVSIELSQTKPVLTHKKIDRPEETIPVARSGNKGDVRNKKTRE